jgi:RND family efflux transporter MFP subunit
MFPWVKVGQTAEVFVEAYGDRKFQGKLWRISPTIDQNKRTFVVEALIQNSAGELKPGSYAKARIQTAKSEEIRLVPVRAVNYVLGTNKIYVVDAGGRIQARDVKVGDRFDQDVEILEGGVKDGERVATTQLSQLDTGMEVKVAQTPERRAN